jgi:N-methylhydantoinase B
MSGAHKPGRFDPIAMEVFSNRLLSITEDMAITMMRASFSSQIKERRDFSVGLFDTRGRLIAQGTHVPIQLASLLGSMEAVLKVFSPADMRDGDAYICNDPYLTGGTHLPDISLVSPIFSDGRLVGFAANIGHHNDIGGAVPGSTSALARSIFEEGIRIPATQIVHAGKMDENVLNLIAQNSRLPEERRLDLGVQVSVNNRGANAFREVVARMGLEAMEGTIDDMIAYTSDRLRRCIGALGSGTFDFTTWLDDDGMGGDPVPIKVAVHVEGESIVFDFAGTGNQVRGGLNVPQGALRATAYYCVKALLDPELMPNQGMMDSIIVRAPLGSILNPRHPAAVGARSIVCQKAAGAIFGALRGVLPEERLIASGNDILPSFLMAGTREDGSIFVWGETLGGGSGARFDSDGMDAIHVHVTNTLNMPTEALENEYPLMVEEYALVEGSGGPGRHRGGMGIAREVRVLREGTTMNCRLDSHRFAPLGIAGGLEGGKARLLRNPGRENAADMPSKVANVPLQVGETIRIETPGGGGFGPPDERGLDAIASDLRDGIISQDAAQAAYGTERVRQALHRAKQ